MDRTCRQTRAGATVAVGGREVVHAVAVRRGVGVRARRPGFDAVGLGPAHHAIWVAAAATTSEPVVFGVERRSWMEVHPLIEVRLGCNVCDRQNAVEIGMLLQSTWM